MKWRGKIDLRRGMTIYKGDIGTLLCAPTLTCPRVRAEQLCQSMNRAIGTLIVLWLLIVHIFFLIRVILVATLTA